MKDKMTTDEEAAMEAAWERSAGPYLRDILKREYNEAQGRPQNVALEKWGPMIEERIMRDMERDSRKQGPKEPDRSPTPAKHPKRGGPDMDRD